jgi:hypothetical protein
MGFHNFMYIRDDTEGLLTSFNLVNTPIYLLSLPFPLTLSIPQALRTWLPCLYTLYSLQAASLELTLWKGHLEIQICYYKCPVCALLIVHVLVFLRP